MKELTLFFVICTLIYCLILGSGMGIMQRKLDNINQKLDSIIVRRVDTLNVSAGENHYMLLIKK